MVSPAAIAVPVGFPKGIPDPSSASMGATEGAIATLRFPVRSPAPVGLSRPPPTAVRSSHRTSTVWTKDCDLTV